MLRDTVSSDVVARIHNSFSGRKPEEVAQRKRGYEILKRSTAKLAKAGLQSFEQSAAYKCDHSFLMRAAWHSSGATALGWFV